MHLKQCSHPRAYRAVSSSCSSLSCKGCETKKGRESADLDGEGLFAVGVAEVQVVGLGKQGVCLARLHCSEACMQPLSACTRGANRAFTVFLR